MPPCKRKVNRSSFNTAEDGGYERIHLPTALQPQFTTCWSVCGCNTGREAWGKGQEGSCGRDGGWRLRAVLGEGGACLSGCDASFGNRLKAISCSKSPRSNCNATLLPSDGCTVS